MGRTTAGQATAAGASEDAEGRLVVDARGTVALLDAEDTARVRFEGIAVGVGVFHDVAGRRIRIRAGHLDGVAKRLAGVFIRDLHRENIGATVGLVHAAKVEGDEVHFTGDVRVPPFVDMVRAFWDRIRFHPLQSRLPLRAFLWTMELRAVSAWRAA